MTNSNIKIYKTSYSFSVKNVELDKYESSKSSFPDTAWTIKFNNKRTINNEEVIDLHLMCSPLIDQSQADGTPISSGNIDWICEAEATVTLRSNKFGQNLNKKLVLRKTFTNINLCKRFSECIKCTELGNYFQNDFLDVAIHANPIRYVVGNVKHTRLVFQFAIEDVFTHLNNDWVKVSPDVIVQGTTFFVKVQKIKKCLFFFLHHKKDSRNLNWSWNVKCSFKLLSFDTNLPPIRQTINRIFNSLNRNEVFNKFSTWADFIDPTKKFVQDDEAILEVDLEVDPPESIFSSPIPSIDSNPNALRLMCSICLQSVIGRNPTTTKCGHSFCRDCIHRAIIQSPKCPVCNTEAISTDLRRVFI